MATRIFDLLFSGILLLILSPLFLVIAILIKLDSRGPVFFRQERMGKEGKPFFICKFRTMFYNPQYKGPNLTRKNDPRITNLGGFLRHTKLDELPQLVNVFKGEMSVVGPRPEYVSHLPYFAEEEKELLKIKPGIVGPGQISERHEVEHYPPGVDVEEYYIKYLLHKKLSLELDYLREKTFLKDVCFVFKTGYLLLITTLRISFFLRDKKRIALFFLDIGLVALSYYCAFLLRYDFIVPKAVMGIFWSMLPYVIGLRMLSFLVFGLYQGLSIYASLGDIVNIAKAIGFSSVLIMGCAFLTHVLGHPRSVFIMDPVLIFIFLAASRFSMRVIREETSRMRKKISNRTLIVGSVKTAESLLRELAKENPSKFDFFGLIITDKENEKVGKVVQGVKILGTIQEFREIVRLSEIETVILTHANPEIDTIKEVMLGQKDGGYKALIYSHGIKEGVITRERADRRVEVEDLILPNVRDYLPDHSETFRNERILITGAAGLLGKELSKRIAGFKPAYLMLLDIDSNGLFHLYETLRTMVPEKALINIHLDVTDRERIKQVFLQEGPPTIVYHCAREHRSHLFANPYRTIHTNILGAKVVSELVREFRISKFFMVSSDKALVNNDLVSMSIRLAEMVAEKLLKGGQNHVFSILRIGNIIESPQGVVNMLRRQIAAGGPVRLSDPRCSRYFARLPDTVSFILDASTVSHNGEVLCSNQEERIDIDDIARRLILYAGKIPEQDIKIEYTGLREGEVISVDKEWTTRIQKATLFPQIFGIPYGREKETMEGDFREELENIVDLVLEGKEEVFRRVFDLAKSRADSIDDNPQTSVHP